MRFVEILNEYLKLYPEEVDPIKLAREQAAFDTESNLVDRKNFVGHFTAGALVVNRHAKRVLMLEHKLLRKWLLPGGHIDEGETPLMAAYRELEEETGLTPEAVMYRAIRPGMPLVPFDVDTHYMPENPKRGEDPHHHHDLRYLFVVESDSSIKIDAEESDRFRWIDWEDFITDERFRNMANKVDESICTKSAGSYLAE
jgi:8-oxo-dGTP pyrophosphatase MutT (NUDIX family)